MAKATYSEAWQLFLQILPYPSISGKSGRIDRPWTSSHRWIVRARCTLEIPARSVRGVTHAANYAGSRRDREEERRIEPAENPGIVSAPRAPLPNTDNLGRARPVFPCGRRDNVLKQRERPAEGLPPLFDAPSTEFRGLCHPAPVLNRWL